MRNRGLGEHVKKSGARCPFPDHDDQHPSFSVFRDDAGDWRWKCWGRCNASGDAIDFICRLDHTNPGEGLRQYRKEAKEFRSLNIDLDAWEYRLSYDVPVAEFDWFSCVQALAMQGDYICKLAKARGYDVVTLWHLISKELIGQYDGHCA